MTGDGPRAKAGGGWVDTRELVLDRQFDRDSLHEVRAAVQAHAVQIGLPEDLAGDVILAVHELAANVIAHGAGRGRLRLSAQPGRLVFEIADAGRARESQSAGDSDDVPASDDPVLSGDHDLDAPAIPWPVEEGHGLWLVQQVAARLDLRSDDRGTRAVVTFRVPDSR